MTPNQGFAYGDNCLALQFHPEASEAMVRGWLAKGTAAVAAAGYDMDEILAEVARWAPGAERAGAAMMEVWLGERFERLRPRAVARVGPPAGYLRLRLPTSNSCPSPTGFFLMRAMRETMRWTTPRWTTPTGRFRATGTNM